MAPSKALRISFALVALSFASPVRCSCDRRLVSATCKVRYAAYMVSTDLQSGSPYYFLGFDDREWPLNPALDPVQACTSSALAQPTSTLPYTDPGVCVSSWLTPMGIESAQWYLADVTLIRSYNDGTSSTDTIHLPCQQTYCPGFGPMC